MNVKKLLIGCAVVAAAYFVWTSLDSDNGMSVNGRTETVKSVDDSGILVLASGLRVRPLGVKDGNEQAKVYAKNSLVGKRVSLTRDSSQPATYRSSRDTIRAYVTVCETKGSLWRLVAKFGGREVLSTANTKDSTEAILKVMDPGPGPEPMTDVELALYMKQRTFCILTRHGSGTGFFINEEGLAITNSHVMEYADEKTAIIVRYSKEKDNNQLNMEDKRNIKNIKHSAVMDPKQKDITIFTVDLENGETVPYFHLAKEHVPQGTKAAIYGNPEGYVASFDASGVVSKYEPKFQYAGRVYADCPVVIVSTNFNHGNSGGPICDEYGRVYGVSTWSISNTKEGGVLQNIRFGIDILTVRDMLDAMHLDYGGR